MYELLHFHLEESKQNPRLDGIMLDQTRCIFIERDVTFNAFALAHTMELTRSSGYSIVVIHSFTLRIFYDHAKTCLFMKKSNMDIHSHRCRTSDLKEKNYVSILQLSYAHFGNS